MNDHLNICECEDCKDERQEALINTWNKIAEIDKKHPGIENGIGYIH